MKKIIIGLSLFIALFLVLLPAYNTNAANIINFGSEYQFDTGSKADISITKLDATHVAIAYQDTSDSNYGKVIYGVISGGNILTFPGSEVTFNSASTSNISIATLSSTEICIAFTDVPSGNTGHTIYGVLSGNNFTFPGTKVNFSSSTSSHLSLVSLNSTDIAVAWNDSGGNDGRVLYGYKLGNGWNFPNVATPNSFSSSTVSHISMVALSSTEIAVAWGDSTGNDGRVLYGSKLGNGWNFPNVATPNSFNNSPLTALSLVNLSSTEIAVAWSAPDIAAGAVLYGSKLGNGWNFPNVATPNNFSNAPISSLSMVTLSSTEIAVSWSDTTNNDGRALYGSKLGNGWNFANVASPPVFNSDGTSYIAATALNGTDLTIAYYDSGVSPGGGAGVIGQFGEQQESAIPELPKSNLWKIVVAILALGLVVGIVAWRKKDKSKK